MHKSKSKGRRVGGGGRFKNQLYKKPFKWLYKNPRCAHVNPQKRIPDPNFVSRYKISKVAN
jgi:hypothetical protein